jgi:hypothetical protein
MARLRFNGFKGRILLFSLMRDRNYRPAMRLLPGPVWLFPTWLFLLLIKEIETDFF